MICKTVSAIAVIGAVFAFSAVVMAAVPLQTPSPAAADGPKSTQATEKDELDIYEAVLRFMFHDTGIRPEKGEVAFIGLVDGGDPPVGLLARFKRSKIHVLPVSNAEQFTPQDPTMSRRFRDKGTKSPGTEYYVGTPDRVEKNEAIVLWHIQFTTRGEFLGKYIVVRSHGHWRVKGMVPNFGFKT